MFSKCRNNFSESIPNNQFKLISVSNYSTASVLLAGCAVYDIEGCKMLSRRVTTRRARSLVSGPWLRADHNHWAHPRPGSTSQALAPATSLRHLYSGTSSRSLQSQLSRGSIPGAHCAHCPRQPSSLGLLPTLLQTLTVSNFSSNCVSLAEDKTLTAVTTL